MFPEALEFLIKSFSSKVKKIKNCIVLCKISFYNNIFNMESVQQKDVDAVFTTGHFSEKALYSNIAVHNTFEKVP